MRLKWLVTGKPAAEAQAQHQPECTHADGRQDVAQIMCPESNPTEANHHDEEARDRNGGDAPTARLDCRHDEKDKLSVKERCADSMSAGKTVAGPVDKPTVHERAVAMDQDLDPFVEQHPAGNRSEERRVGKE